MLYLNTDNTQTFALIPRANILDTLLTDVKVKLVNETTKDVTILTAIDINVVKDVTYIELTSLSAILVEDTFFNLTIFDDTDDFIFFKELAYCTDQNLDNITINENQYNLVQLTNNDYITI